MKHPSITSSESFIGRAQRSEAARVVVWIAVLAAMIVLTIMRRIEHGMVMSHDEIFYPYIGVLIFALLVQMGLWAVLRRANRAGSHLPAWIWKAGAAFDVAVAGSLLLIAALWSPRGPIPALSAPPLLLMPLVVLLSILRLRPWFTLLIGLAGAAIHLALVFRAIMIAESTSDPVYFSYSVILVLTAFAATVVTRHVRAHVREAADEAAAHERADRQVIGMQRDLSVAREIQLGLLPSRPPVLAGFDIVGMNRPADQTGGDYYDWQSLPDGSMAVVLPDVTGHGIGPALVMAICRAYARATAPMSQDPAALLTRLNSLIYEDLPNDRFITLVLAVLDQGGGARLISAGHGPTLLYRASTGKISRFSGDGRRSGRGVWPDHGTDARTGRCPAHAHRRLFRMDPARRRQGLRDSAAPGGAACQRVSRRRRNPSLDR